jgi:hypothetical protein
MEGLSEGFLLWVTVMWPAQCIGERVHKFTEEELLCKSKLMGFLVLRLFNQSNLTLIR